MQVVIIVMHALFLSTLSLRRATTNNRTEQQARHDFYPRSPCGERRCPAARCTHPAGISIHALLAESDPTSYMPAIFDILFLSTLSLRRATHVSELRVTSNVHFYPRSPCGERQSYLDNKTIQRAISIHALLAESDETQKPNPTR